MYKASLTKTIHGSWAYAQTGNGPPVVLVHGVGLQAESWGGQIEVLAKRHGVVTVDLPGHGAAPRLSDVNVSIETYCDCLNDLFESVVPAPALLVGHSLGALIAIEFAQRYAEKLCGIVALSAVYQRDAAATAAVKARYHQIRDAENVADLSAVPVTRWFGESPVKEQRQMADLCRDWLKGGDPVGYAQAYGVFANYTGPSSDRLRELVLPTVFVTGADDPNSTPEMSAAMAQLVPKGEAKTIQGAKHMVQMTHADELNKIISRFAATVFE